MGSLVISFHHDGVEYDADIVTIKSTHLGPEDHGIWTAALRVVSDGWGQTIGCHELDQPPDDDPDAPGRSGRQGTAFGMDHIIRIVETVGCGTWEALTGKQCLLLTRGRGSTAVVGIASLDGERALIFEEHRLHWFPREG